MVDSTASDKRTKTLAIVEDLLARRSTMPVKVEDAKMDKTITIYTPER